MTLAAFLIIVAAAILGSLMLWGVIGFLEAWRRRLDPDHREPWEHVRREPS